MTHIKRGDPPHKTYLKQKDQGLQSQFKKVSKAHDSIGGHTTLIQLLIQLNTSEHQKGCVIRSNSVGTTRYVRFEIILLFPRLNRLEDTWNIGTFIQRRRELVGEIKELHMGTPRLSDARRINPLRCFSHF